MRIAILDDYQDAVRSLPAFELLAGHDVQVLNQSWADPAELALRVADCEALVMIRERTRVDAALLAQLPKLKLISQTGKISNHLDLDACTRHGVAVAEGVGSPVAPSELCWALILAASRHLPQYVAHQQQNQWQISGVGLGRTLNGLTLGIWGYGKIGQRIAQYAKAFGMQVQVWGSDSSRALAQSHGFSASDSKSAFFASSDVLSLHLRLNEATRGVVTRADLALMKPDSLFVNISRAELVEPGALYAELAQTPSKRAALDVYEAEPALPQNEPLLQLPNVLGTPHLGYVERNSYELYFRTAFENVKAYAEGRPQNLANGEALNPRL